MLIIEIKKEEIDEKAKQFREEAEPYIKAIDEALSGADLVIAMAALSACATKGINKVANSDVPHKEFLLMGISRFYLDTSDSIDEIVKRIMREKEDG